MKATELFKLIQYKDSIERVLSSEYTGTNLKATLKEELVAVNRLIKKLEGKTPSYAQ